LADGRRFLTALRPSTGRHIRSLSGSLVAIRSDEQGWPWIECVKCRVRISY